MKANVYLNIKKKILNFQQNENRFPWSALSCLIHAVVMEKKKPHFDWWIDMMHPF